MGILYKKINENYIGITNFVTNNISKKGKIMIIPEFIPIRNLLFILLAAIYVPSSVLDTEL